MPDLGVSDKLQPCLLDRLTDDDPKNSQESRSQRVISYQTYRAGVKRDLNWLFNASAHFPMEGSSAINIEDYAEARYSVINFGVKHLFGVMTPKLQELERQLTKVLYAFEPRILPNTLKVRSKMEGNIITLELDGELWVSPQPERLHIRTRLDIQGGQFSFES